jgi:hypothetical protein
MGVLLATDGLVLLTFSVVLSGSLGFSLNNKKDHARHLTAGLFSFLAAFGSHLLDTN